MKKHYMITKSFKKRLYITFFIFVKWNSKMHTFIQFFFKCMKNFIFINSLYCEKIISTKWHQENKNTDRKGKKRIFTMLYTKQISFFFSPQTFLSTKFNILLSKVQQIEKYIFRRYYYFYREGMLSKII